MKSGKTSPPARRGSVPRAAALFAGTIGFVAAVVLGMAGGAPPATSILRGAGCGLALGGLAFAAGVLGVRVVKESPTGGAEAAAAPPAPVPGREPGSAEGPAAGGPGKAVPAAAGESGAAGGAMARSTAKAGPAPAVR